MKRNSLAFGILQLLGYLLVFSIMILVIGAKFGDPLVKMEAKNIHVMLRILRVPNILLGNMVYLPEERLSFEITWQCSGMFSISLYTVVYLTFPRIRRNLWEWFFGVSVLYVVNFFRVLTSILLYHHMGEEVFSLFHYILGPAMMFGVVVLLLGDLLVKSLKERRQN
ncbi:archaeosortase family protein ArtF [Thermococcus gammatolerans]|uniref:Uncharacterized protein n=1 Tax=Thermococcus gammatolerans (strain DSM 15229 / JCM 11827 / EJ3) TaxID=593117 RepID=C5A6A3_THEGJ|nr:archaeosortase family protein ArtF [Thermococcus gammatolerans]ACS33765.1 Conserved hypothetical protein [Thermococcus gammatolerans EJ3]